MYRIGRQSGYNGWLPPLSLPAVIVRLSLFLSLIVFAALPLRGGEFSRDVRPVLTKYCGECHSGNDANGDVDFSVIKSSEQVDDAYELWESVAKHLKHQTMPPEDQPRPTEKEATAVLNWYQQFVDNIQPRPAVMQPRRLSVTEYRNTLHSILGFDMEVEIIEAEQTIAQKSMVVKLLSVDPPGKSGFKNDTHANPLTTNTWDQYSYLVDAGLEELFSSDRAGELTALCGKRQSETIEGERLSKQQLRRLVTQVLTRARRRDPAAGQVDTILSRLVDVGDKEIVEAVKFELKAILMSPAFIYRGLLVEGQRGQSGQQQTVDAFEFAERLSYFLWADMPDAELMDLARSGKLLQRKIVTAQIDRMLASPKSRRLAEVFATEWFTLSEIELVSNNPPVAQALKSQPIDFMHYLFSNDRPILEMIDSKVTFINPHTARMYGKDAKQMTRYPKQKGIEVESIPNQKIELRESPERGGILTMPGVLAMNRGPILRGTWMLERILGEELPEPPANVGQVPPNRGKEKLTFRQRFEQHRADTTCAVCHDKIDPLGFALQSYDNGGKYMKNASYEPSKKQRKAASSKDSKQIDPKQIDTSGKLPSGETFADIGELKTILKTSQREAVVRNVVQRTMAYALARKLELFDQPAVDALTKQMIEKDATWRDLFVAIAESQAFRETILSK